MVTKTIPHNLSEKYTGHIAVEAVTTRALLTALQQKLTLTGFQDRIFSDMIQSMDRITDITGEAIVETHVWETVNDGIDYLMERL